MTLHLPSSSSTRTSCVSEQRRIQTTNPDAVSVPVPDSSSTSAWLLFALLVGLASVWLTFLS